MTVPFALSVHSLVNSVGSYVGFASILAVAILVLLYFAHARETASLRERLEEAQQRISGLEARIAQLAQMQSRVRPAAPVKPPTAVPGRPVAAPRGAVPRVPNPATAAGAVTAAPAAGLAQAAVLPRAGGVALAAPAGMAGPALASATKLIADAPAAGAPDDTMFVPPAAANGRGGAEATALVQPSGVPAMAASARGASASPRAALPPRAHIGPEAEAPAAGGDGGRVRRIGGRPEPAPISLPAFDDEPTGRSRLSGAMLPLLVAGLAVVVIIVGLIVINNSGGSTSANIAHGNATPTTGQALHNHPANLPPFNAATVTVSVLNGTAQQGLAGKVAARLAGDGYKQGNVTNAASQTEPATLVYYVRGKGTRTLVNRIAAQHIDRTLALPAKRVRPAGAGVLQSCAISATGASLGSCRAQVIVSVGQDRVNLATG